jgi:E3 ubiquitin-protein ligase TRIP12
MPRLNKHLDDKWVKHCQGLHRNKLKTMKAAIDNKPPPQYVHLVQNLKKQQMDEERYSQIERDNYLLLDKMSYIMTHPQLLDEKYMGAPVTYVSNSLYFPTVLCADCSRSS